MRVTTKRLRIAATTCAICSLTTCWCLVGATKLYAQAVAVNPQTVEDEERLVKTYKNMDDARRMFTKAAGYAFDAADDVANDQPIRPYPVEPSGGEVHEFTLELLQLTADRALEDVRAVRIPELAPPPVLSFNDLTSNDVGARRAALRRQVNYISESTNPYSAQLDLDSRLSDVSVGANGLIPLLDQLRDIYGSMAERTMLTPLEGIFGTTWFLLDTELTPKVKEVVRAADRKRGDLSATALSTRQQQTVLIGATKILLTQERASLQQQITTYENWSQEIQLASQALDQQATDIAVRRQGLPTFEVALQQASGSVAQAQQELAAANTRLNQLTNARDDAQNLANADFRSVWNPFRCPNGNDYANCSHGGLKMSYDNWRAQKQSDATDLNNQVGRQKTIRDNWQGTVTSRDQTVQSAIARLNNARQQLASLQGEYDTRVQDLTSKYRGLFSDNDLQRVRLFSDENQADVDSLNLASQAFSTPITPPAP